MNFHPLRCELHNFYLHGDAERAKAFADRCFPLMEDRFHEGMSILAQKCLQYDVITEEFEPVLFRHSPFFYETGVLTSLSDGAFKAKGYDFVQVGGWTYTRNKHLFAEQDEDLYRLMQTHKKEQLYLICGPYNDVSQHFNFNCRPFLEIGAKGIYKKAKQELPLAQSNEEKEFLNAVCHGMLALRKMAEKFSKKATELLENETDSAAKANLALIADTAARIPWEAPKTFYEALAALAFLRTAMGSLEGAGPNTFGRMDKDLISFYRADLESGRLTAESAYELICHFLLIWDCHYDHDMPMEGYADHELENTYTLGGCDDEGAPLYNEITEMLLRATREESIIFPKIKCRFSKSSPKAYLDEIDRSIIKGTSTVLLQNDDATIPALVRAGRPLHEAWDYLITGCWDVSTFQEKFDHGNYLNLLKPFEYAVHGLTDRIAAVQIPFETFNGTEDFEELYQKTLHNCRLVLAAKTEVVRRGGQIFHKVTQFPIFSATLEGCIENHADFTRNGAKYRDDFQLLFGFPNIVDSLLAIKELVFEQKRLSLSEYLSAVRANWEGCEELRRAATRCHGWGDGSPESCALGTRFNNDLFALCQEMTGSYGGKIHIGHLTYTEIRWWGEKTLATPDGRKSGEYFSQGLTPSRLKRIPNVGDVINSMAAIDPSTMAAGSVVNVMLPSSVTLAHCEAFLRAVATSGIQSLQLNCVSREVLLDAQRNPEAYHELIVRVTGFSAKFTALSKGWQDEILSRNFYE